MGEARVEGPRLERQGEARYCRVIFHPVKSKSGSSQRLQTY